MKARGRHSEVYLIGRYAIKVFKRQYLYNFKKEVKFLQLLQPFNFVPRLYAIDESELKIAMERIDGINISKILKNCSNVREVVIKCLDICFLLDNLKIQKEEMSRPDKHILLKGHKVYFIDFERSRFSSKPSNVTQFIVYLTKKGFIDFRAIKNLLLEQKILRLL